ncbi:MAG: 6-hydroxymethylpterin diphosphokinase MptE-like protein [Candidatus Altiarchaeota archaeon]
MIKVDWETTYELAKKKFELNYARDDEAAEMLGNLLPKNPDLEVLKSLITNRTCIVFGCGPSLEGDFYGLLKKGFLEKSTTIASDGAVSIFLQNGLFADINVTDLDGPEKDIIKANNLGSFTVVHAHGDNISQLKEIVPKLNGKIIGTTQKAPLENVFNFGGFTDGDRATYLCAHFGPSLIILAGMDFGVAPGHYSHTTKIEVKEDKLAFAKQLIEELASTSDINIINVTGKGEDLTGIKRVKIRELSGILENPPK